ncbi:MAG: ArsA family ATPase [Ilumatobacteraceae bacterium]|nr:ArsA family ATPase [Ilumatobacteraceae bacterium]
MTAVAVDAMTLTDTIDHSTLLLTCGPGGVGKTTTAAAIGVAAANSGRRVVVVTVDPARRLADALGLDDGAAADEPHQVDGVGADEGELWALMLDDAATFDRLVREQTASEEQAEAILNNPIYGALSRSLAGAQEYMAIERLHQLFVSDEWDLVIVDTPPSRNAIDLLGAPDRLVAFLSNPVYRALTVGQRTFARVTNAASSMFLWAVRRLAGPQIVEDTVAFFRSLTTVEEGLRRRAGEVRELLRADETAFVVVSSPRAEAIAESEHLIGALRDDDFPFGGVVINLIHPLPEQLDPADRAALDDVADGPLAEHLAWHDELTELAVSEREELAGLAELADDVPVVELPLQDTDVHNVDGLLGLAERLAP